MSDIRLVNVCKSFGQEKVLNNYNLSVPAGSFFALLGPSGCGKTTILRLIAGFDKVDSGQIFLGGQEITNLPANERSINTVFQNYALFPHLNVFENVAYSLRIKKVPNDLVAAKVLKILQTVHLEKQIYKTIEQLSGGQQQRVALARAIINEPDVLLLDEPLAALDLKLRERVLIELIELQKKLKTTFIYITHDQDEALAVASSMAIMNHDGKIEQIGVPSQVYDQPKTTFVAKFVGSTNIIRGLLNTSGLLELDSLRSTSNCQQGDFNQWSVFSLRPEKIVLVNHADLTLSNVAGYQYQLSGKIASVIYHGKSTLYRVHINEHLTLTVFDQNRSENKSHAFDIGNEVQLFWRMADVVLLEN